MGCKIIFDDLLRCQLYNCSILTRTDLFGIRMKQKVYSRDNFIEVEGFCKVVICSKGGCAAVADIHGGDDQDRRLGENRVCAQQSA